MLSPVLGLLGGGAAFFKQGLAKWLRRAVPYVRLAAAVLLVVAGAYIIFYWVSGSAAVLPG